MMKQFSALLKVMLAFLLVLGASGILYWLGVMPATAWLVLLSTFFICVGLFYLGQFMLSKREWK